MATFKFKSMGRRMRRMASRVPKASADIDKGAALIGSQLLVDGTPVKTGKAATNWQAGLLPPVGVLETAGPDRAKPSAKARIRAAIAAWMPNLGPLFVGNNVPYIDRLDKGHSKQAPGGFTAAARAAVGSFLRRQSFLRGIIR